MQRTCSPAILFVALSLCFLVGSSPPAHAGPGDDKLSEFDFLLLGLTIRPEPEVQVVPRNTPTGISIVLGFSDSSAEASGLLALLPVGIEVAAELVGPGIASPIALRGSPGELLPIPPLQTRGLYLVRDIRLEKDGETFLRGLPDSATIEVVDQILITQVVTRPLTLEEIRQKGILFGDDDFTGFNFTIALNLESRLVTFDFPVVFDSNNIPVPIPRSRDLNLTGLGLPSLSGAAMVPILMDVDLGGADETELPELAGLTIPGLLVIPGEVGFLNQFFSALLLVSNGAPAGSSLVVSGLEATIELPPGDDQVPGTADDPLEIAETMAGQAFRLPILGVGPDSTSGTGDDTDRFAAGQQGQAEFLVEGRREGFHPISFDIAGTLEGLPIGPVPISGSARGGVLVRNPFFNMTFTAPSTVRTGEEFSLFVTVTNISQAIANLVSVTLNQASLAGATILGDATRQVDTLLPGDSEAFEFRFRSNQTGQVTASYLRFDGTESTGDLLFTLGIGERGIPLSPDTIVLPSSVNVLPDDLLFAALRVLGQAWSIATAPPGTIPQGVAFVSKGEVFDRATELAEAGFRVQVGESLERALQSLAFDWIATDAAGFEQIVRETSAGREFLNAIGESIATMELITDFHRNVAQSFTTRPPHVLVGVGNGVGAAPISWDVRDAVGRVLQVGGPSSLSNAGFMPLGGSDPLEAGRGVALLTRLGSSRYEVHWTGTGTGGLDLTVSVPRAAGGTSFYSFSGVGIDAGVQGKVEIDLLRSTPTLTLSIDRNGDGFFEEEISSSVEEVLESFGPELLAATVVGPETLSDADPWGRVVALLFDREVRAAEAESVSRYAIEDNHVLGAIRQLSGRLVFLFLRDPVGEIIPRQVIVSGLFDASGKPMVPSMASLPITSRIVDPGARVTGRVLRADGAPLTGAQIFYLNFSRDAGLFAISTKGTEPDGSYRFDFVRQSPDGPFAMRALDPETGSQQQLTTSVRTNGEHIVIDLVLLGRGGVTGTVRDLNGDPVPGAQVLVTSQVDPASFVLTEADGAGRYEAPGIVVGPVAVKAVLGTSSGVAAGNIQRAGTFTTIDVTINLNAGRVAGGVFENDPELGSPTPVSSIEVHFLIPHPGFPGDLVAASGATAADGTFVFENVPSGEFRVLAIDRVIGRQVSRPGTLVAGGLVEDFDLFFTTDEFGVIQGFVRTASGAPAPGAVVTAAGRQVSSAADGSFEIVNVPLGTHSVRAVDTGSGRSATASATLNAPGDIASVSLTFPGAGRIVVTVLDAAGQPLASHPVFRLQGSACSGSQRLTDSAGIAIFDGVPVPGGSFKSILEDDVAQGSATIQRDGDVAAVALRFGGFGTVTGTVRDDRGEPAFGANVILGAKRLDLETCSLVQDSLAKLVQTGQDGTFAFGRVPVGAVSVSASSVFFPTPATAKGSLLFNGDSVDFTLNLTSTTAGELNGTVFLPDGVTPSGPGVSVTASSATFPDVTVTTDVDGRFAFAKIFPAGTYLLSASDVVTGGVAEQMVSLLADQSLTADLRLLGRGAVEVTVLDGAGDPVEEAFVELRRSSFPFDEAAGAITAAGGGVLRFENITEGEFTVTASDSLGRGGRADGVVLGEGETTDVTVSLTVTGTVRATVLTPDGSEPIPNAQVRLRQGTTGRLLGSTTSSSAPDSLGRVEFRFVPAGTVLLTATDPVTGRVGEASGTIETEGEVIDLEIRVLGLGSLSGIVTSNENPVAGATVDLTSRTGLSSGLANLDATATTGSAGEFAFEGVPVGTFTLKASVPGLLLTGSAEGAITADGEDITDIEIALQPSGTVLGTVFRPDGVTPVPGASVTLDPPGSVLHSKSNASGGFRFEFVPIGDFELRAEEGADAGIAEGTLHEGEELEIDIIFNGTGTVEGTAFDSDGVTPLTAGLVRLNAPAPFARSQTATVAPDGTFRFLRIPVGTFSLSLSVSGSPLRGNATGVIAHDGEVVTIDMQLADAATVLGRIVKPDGTTPAPNVVVSASGAGFSLNDLTAADGTFRIEGIPLGDFSVRAEDPASNGLAIASGTATVNGEEIDLGDIVLDNSPIAVASIAPDGTTPVPPDTPITIRFTDPVAPASLPGRLNVSNVSAGGNIPGARTVSPDGLEVTFTASAFLPPRSDIQVTVSRNIEDTLGRKLGTDFVSGFTTSGAVVTGLVTLGGSPIEGADVTLTSGGDSRTTVTDAPGRYRFEDVGIGNASVQGVDAASGQAGSAVVTVDPDDSVIAADIALAFAGSVSGQVLRFDGTPAGADLEVLILRGNQALGLATTDVDGRFLIGNITLGDFIVDVTDPATGDRGRSNGVLVTPGETVELTVQLLGFGSVRLTVRDSIGDIVPDAEASLSFNRFGSSTTLDMPSRETDGSLLFTQVLAGSFTVTARDPSTGLTTSGSGTAVAGEEVPIELSLAPIGAIFGIIVEPDGATPVAGADVRVYRNIGNAIAAVTSAGDGSYRFEELPTSNTYRIDVLVDGQRRARVRDIEIPPNGEAEVNIQLNGLGTVTGQVLPPPGESLSGSVTVELRSLTPDLGGTFSDDDASDGTYEITGVPVGPFTLSARDAPNKFLGEAAGELPAHGETVVVDIQMLDNAFSWSSSGEIFTDANDARYRIARRGALRFETDTLFRSDGAAQNLEVAVAGASTVSFEGSDIGSEEDGERELATDTQLIDGLVVQRKIFVPIEGYFARYLEIFQNVTGEPIDFSATIRSFLRVGTSSQLQLIATSSGDANVDASDFWIVADDAVDNDPFEASGRFPTAWVLAGEQALAPSQLDFSASGFDGELAVRHDLSVPPGERVMLMHFVALQSFRDSAELAAERLAALPPEALAGLGLDEIADIVNFDVPADGTSSVEPLPPLDGRVTGTTFMHDGTTALGPSTHAGNLSVKFNSDYPLFNRVREVFINDDGFFLFNGRVTASTSFAIPRVGFTLRGEKTYKTLAATGMTTGDFFGRSLLSHAHETGITASSSFASSTGPEQANDFGGSDWRPENADPDPTLELTFPVLAQVDEIRILPDSAAQLDELEVTLFGSTGEILGSESGVFSSGSIWLVVPIHPPIDDVQRVSLSFTGSSVRVQEVLVSGSTSEDIGSSMRDVVFTNSAAMEGTTRRADGSGVQSHLSVRVGTQNLGFNTDEAGDYLLAPLPVGASPVPVSASALVGHDFLVESAAVVLTQGTTTRQDFTFAPGTTVSGRVFAADGTPAVNESVVIFPETGFGWSTNADAQGQYLFVDVPSGNYRLRVVEHGRTIFVPITVNAPTPLVQDIHIPVFGTINLTVLYETAPGDPVQPAQGARITTIDGVGERSSGSTNASGALTITNVSGGPFTLNISHRDNTASITTVMGSIDFEAQVLPLTALIPGLGTVTGTVFFADDTPAAFSLVELSGAGIHPLNPRFANSAGVYSFTQVEARRLFTVVARHPAANRSHIFGMANGELAGQESITNVDVTLPGTGTVAVTVTEEDTTPIPGASITIQDAFSVDFRDEGVTNASGQRSIAIVPEGPFTIQARHSDGTFIGSATGHMPGGGTAAVVEVSIISEVGATVEGFVRAGDGMTPVAAAPVELFEEDGVSLIASTVADETGFYRFLGAVAPDSTGVVRAHFPGDESLSDESTVTATNTGQTFAIDLVLPVNVVKGSVIESDGTTAVPNATIELHREGTFDRQTSAADAAGAFFFLNQPSGSVELVAEDVFGLVGRARVDVPQDTLVIELDVLLPAFGTVEGTIFDASGAPPIHVASTPVELTNANLKAPRTVIPDAAGGFLFDRVAQGSFTVTYDGASTSGAAIPASTTSRLGDLGATSTTLGNLSRALGVVLNPSTVFPGFGPERAIDGNLNTSWFTVDADTNPFFEIILPGDATVTEIRMFGNRQFAEGFDFFAGIFQLLDEGGLVLFDSGVVDLPAPDRDLSIPIPAIPGVRRVSFTGTDGDGGEGFAELEVIGRFDSGTNLSVGPGVATNVSSSFSASWPPSRAIDGSLQTSWFTERIDPNPFFEVILPAAATVSELRMFGNRESSDGFDFFQGFFELFDETGAVLYDSGLIDLPAPVRDAVLLVPDVPDVRRVRFTGTDGDANEKGFSELEIFGRFQLDQGAPFPDITLPGLGDVSGRLLAVDGTPTIPSGDLAPVILEGRQRESRTGVYSSAAEVSTADGTYRFEGVPAGQVTVTVVDDSQAGAATGTVEIGMETLDLDVTLGTAVALPVELGLPAGRRHEIQADGSVRGENLFSGSEVALSNLTVNGKPYPSLASAVPELSDRQLVLGPVRTAGVLHNRKVFVPSDGSFVRFLEILENPNGFPVDLTLDVGGDILASNLMTSSGDAALDGGDGYLAGELDTGAGVAIVYSDNLGALIPDAARTDGEAYRHTWRKVTIPAMGRILVMHFAIQADDRAAAIAQANELLSLTDPAALSGLTAAERSEVVNFSVP